MSHLRAPQPIRYQWIGLLGLITLALVLIGYNVLTTPIAPDNDFAADMLLTNQIRDGDILLTGHYSRWGFHHLGPFWFYLNHLFELLPGLKHASRLQTWQVACLAGNAACLTYATTLLSELLFKGWHRLFTIVFASTCLIFLGTTAMNLWMPARMVMPYLAFFCTLIAISKSQWQHLPWSVLLACLLIHGYITLPLFTLPHLLLAIWLGLKNQPSQSPPIPRRALLTSTLIATLFVVPILIDAFCTHPSNLEKIMVAHQQFADLPKATLREFWYFIRDLLLTGNATSRTLLLATLMIGLLYQLVTHHSLRRSHIEETSAVSCQKNVLKYIAGFSLFTTLLLGYYKTTPSPLYPFIAEFFVAVTALLCSLYISLIFTQQHDRLLTKSVSRILASVLLLTAALLMEPANIPPDTDLVAEREALLTSVIKTPSVALELSHEDLWGSAAGLLVALDQAGIQACLTNLALSNIVTPRYICPQTQKPDFSIKAKEECAHQCYIVTNRVGLHPLH